MVFQVINSDDKVIMQTEDVDCIPTSDELSSMTEAKYRFKIDGKVLNKKKVLDICKELRNG